MSNLNKITLEILAALLRIVMIFLYYTSFCVIIVNYEKQMFVVLVTLIFGSFFTNIGIQFYIKKLKSYIKKKNSLKMSNKEKAEAFIENFFNKKENDGQQKD